MKKISVVKVLFLSMLMGIVTSGCSLLKLQPEFGAEGLPQNELNIRMAVRSYYKTFSAEVIQAADSIVLLSNSDSVKAEAIKWKISATSACADLAFQTDAELSLIDTWLLARQMDLYFNGAGADVFDEHTTIAQETSNNLHQQIDDIAKSVNPRKHYNEMVSFVESQNLNDDIINWSFQRIDTRPLFIQHLEIPDSLYTTTVGTGAEVMNDFTDRISAYNNQLKSQLSWEKDLIVMTLANDSIAEPYLARIDSLSLMLNRLAVVAQESPEMMGVIAVRMREELSPIIYDFNRGMEVSLAQLASERESLQKYLDEQRTLFRDDVQISGKVLIEETTDNLIRFVRKVSWVLIILVIVLVAAFFGVPFAAGYYLAKARFKRKKE